MGYGQFLPIGPVNPTPKPTGKQAADPESTPERQRARRLGSYGADILRDKIKVDYLGQRKAWKKHIGNVVTAFSMALGRQAETLGDVEEERRASAELHMFIFSLVTAGVMRWAGTYVEYRLYPKVLSKSTTPRKLIAADQDWIKRWMPSVPVVEKDYNKQMATFVGNLVPDVGNPSVNYISDKNKGDPYAGLAPDDRVTLVRITETSLDDALDDGTQVVMDQMDEAIFWMEQSPEFGERWDTYSNGNETFARTQILTCLQTIRDQWARDWPYFGKEPMPFDQVQLSFSFERALWAAFLDVPLTRFGHERGFTRQELYSGALETKLAQQDVKNDPWADAVNTLAQGVAQITGTTTQPKPDPHPERGRSYQELMAILDFSNAIIVKLKDLNVVIAETRKGRMAQDTRLSLGDPQSKPSVKIEDSVDRLDELRGLWSWATDYPATAVELAKVRGNEGIKRVLKPLVAA